MVVYGEYLFIENFITGIIILYVTKEICGVKLTKGQKPGFRMILGGVMCGAYSFILFAQLQWAIALVTKLVFAMLVVFLSLGGVSIKPLIRRSITFVIVSFLMGGITIGLMYLTKSTGITCNAAIYLEGITYINITIGATATLLAGVWIKRFFREKTLRQSMYCQVEISIKGKNFRYRGFIDSGNRLVDPYSGKPVVLLSPKSMSHILHELGDLSQRQRLIPYSTLGQKTGDGNIVTAYQTDKIQVIQNQSTLDLDRWDIALYEGDFFSHNCQSFDVLLNGIVLEKSLPVVKEGT